MLTEQDYIEIEAQANKLYSSLENEIIKQITKRINNVGYANTVVENDAMILQEMGLLYSDVVTTIAKNTGNTYDKISQILINAGVKTISYDDTIYISAGLNPIAINQSPSMVQIINATIANTSNNLTNLVNTTAVTSQTAFYNAMNMAYLEVATGAKSYTQAIKDAINKIGQRGVTVKYPSGYQLNLQSAARMNILTSTSQMCGKLQLQRAEELGWDLMELTAHEGARPTHQEWQGKIVSLSGKEGYLSLEDIGYGTIDGFKGINCRHDWYPYYEGSSKAYSDEQLEKWKDTDVLKNSTNSDKIKSNIAKQLDSLGVDYNPVSKLDKELTDEEIIKKIGGKDETKGSCASLSYTYVANKNGLDVIDFRGGESRAYFSTVGNSYKISQLSGIKSVVIENSNDILATTQLLKEMEENKEYILGTGAHNAIVRKIGNTYQYLELQESVENNGWKTLTTKELKERFGCKQSNSVQGIILKPKHILMEVESFKNNAEFEEILGYINTK